MVEADFDEFSDMLDAVCSLLSRGAYAPNEMNTALFCRALGLFTLAQVRAAFDAHVADPVRGRFVPVPADLIAQIESQAANDGRPGADEAWAIAIRSADETVTIVWTPEIATAWQIARPVFDAEDEVGARMAFRDAYGRLVDTARLQRIPARWDVVLGFDVAGRQAAVEQAIAQARLPAESSDDPLLLAGPGASLADLAEMSHTPPAAREALLRARDLLVAKAEVPSPDAAAKVHTAELKAVADELAQRHAEGRT